MGVVDWITVRDDDELVFEQVVVDFRVEYPGDCIEEPRDVTNDVGDEVVIAVPLLLCDTVLVFEQDLVVFAKGAPDLVVFGKGAP